MKYLFVRFTQMLALIVFLSAGLFALLSAMPGNPVDMLIMSNPRVKPEDVIRLKKLRGLDKPWYVQYARWIWGYNEPFRPASINELDNITAELNEENEVKINLDLTKHLENNDYRIQFDEAKQLIENTSPDLWQDISANAALKNMAQNEKVDAILEQVAEENPELYNQIRSKIKINSLQELKVSGLFGATATGLNIAQRFASPGQKRLWFVVTNNAGLETVGSVGITIKENQNKIATNTFNLNHIPSQVVDDPKSFKVNLNNFLNTNQAIKSNYSFKLDQASPGQIDQNGIYTHNFSGEGQKAILFTVSNDKGEKTQGAFSVEESPISDPARFSEGFLFAFKGNKNALGFSSTYKRPVWELLAGPPSACGDGRLSASETCDDGNWINGDGCSATCQVEGISTWAKISNAITGMIVSSGRIGNTLQLMIPAILLSLLIALPLGILSAYKQYSWLDYIVNFIAFIGISLPVFWFGIMIIYLFAENLQWFPAGGMQTPGIEDEGLTTVLLDRLSHAILPTLVLSIAYTGRWLRYMRASMLEILPADYIRTARAKGLSERVVILKHALRNALIPVVTILALSIPALFGGAVLTETVFAWPGIGRLEYDAIVNSDYYVAIVVFLISSVLVMVGNLLADLLYVVVDPRMRHG